LAAPQTIYYAVYDATTSSTTYYAFNDQSITSPSTLNQTIFSQTYPNYLVSPVGIHTLWSIMRDGVTAAMTGDQNGQSAKQLLRQSGYQPYGWYGEEYVVLSQDDDKLYIVPAAGLTTNEKPYVITDYYQTPETYTSIEYGYGAQ
jgi:Tfp pilus assembly protein PilX